MTKIDGGICAAKGFKASGTYCGIKKPAVNFLPSNTPAFASRIGEDEIAANVTSVLIPPRKNSISLSS